MKFKFESEPAKKRESYEVEREIDGLVYKINLVQNADNPTSWELSFIANESESLTNKGLATFNKVADAIHDIVGDARTKHNIEQITFRASKEISGDQKLQEVLKEKFDREPSAFLGFTYENTVEAKFGSMTLGQMTKSFRIDETGHVYGERHYKPKKKITDPFPKDIMTPYVKGELIETFLSTPKNVAILRRGPLEEILPSLLQHLQLAVEEEKIRAGKDPEKQRVDLYERVLKGRFPKVVFTRKGDLITIDFGSDKIDHE